MGCGIKAAYEEAEELAYKEALQKIKEKSPEEILSTLKNLKANHESLTRTDLRLSRNQWNILDNMEFLLKEILS